MKCESCGAEIKAGAKYCEACGSEVTYEMRRQQEQLNIQGCPSCHSSNVEFNREQQGSVNAQYGNRVIYRTVGLCKDCGYTWCPDTSVPLPPAEPPVVEGTIIEEDRTYVGNNNTLLWWILGWVFFFPAPVMVLIWRKKNPWDTKVKIIVTVAFWFFIYIIRYFG